MCHVNLSTILDSPAFPCLLSIAFAILSDPKTSDPPLFLMGQGMPDTLHQASGPDSASEILYKQISAKDHSSI